MNPDRAPTSVRISSSALEALREACRDATAAEPCGLALGRRDGSRVLVEAVRPTPNVHDEPDRGWRIDPDAHLSIRREARRRDREVVATWHGHLVGPPRPGRADLEALHAPGAPPLLIVCGSGPGPGIEVRAYAARRGGAREVPLGS